METIMYSIQFVTTDTIVLLHNTYETTRLRKLSSDFNAISKAHILLSFIFKSNLQLKLPEACLSVWNRDVH